MQPMPTNREHDRYDLIDMSGNDTMTLVTVG